jgi:hypothetical protein
MKFDTKGLKASSGTMTAQITLPQRPSFKATQVSRETEDGAPYQVIMGIADDANGSQDTITIWLPRGFAHGIAQVLWGTGLVRIENEGWPKLYGLTGTVSIQDKGDPNRFFGSFELVGAAGLAVKGAVDIIGVYKP